MKLSYIKINLFGEDYEVWYNYFKGSRATLEEPEELPTWEIEKIVRLTTPDSDLAKEDLEWCEAQPDFEDKVIDAIIETIESEKGVSMSIYEKAIDKLFGKKQVAVLLQNPSKDKKQTKLDITSALTQAEKQYLQVFLREELEALNIAKSIGKTMLKASKEDKSKFILWTEGLQYLKKKHNTLAEIQRKLKRSI